MKLPLLPIGGIFTKAASIVGAVISVVYITFQEIQQKTVESYQACAPGCELTGPAANMPKFMLVIGGVLVATLVFVACAELIGSRRGSV